jgi:hypothetical protein
MLKYNLVKEGNFLIEFDFQHGNLAGTSYRTEKIQPCLVPTCSCGNLFFKNELDNKEDSYFFIDVLDKSVKKLVENNETDDFTISMTNEINDADWQNLYDDYAKIKGALIEYAQPEKIDYKFSRDEIREIKDSVVFSYDRMFPWAIPLVFQVEDEEFIVKDAYCLNPTCNCHGAILDFYKKGEDNPLFHIDFDYKTSKIELLDVFEKKIDTKLLIEKFVDKNKAELEILTSGRHEKLRAVFRKSNPSSLKPQIYSPNPYQNISRNDLCPCGSGKKFKKCHGAD